MPDNTPLESNAMQKQAQLLADALEKAKDSQGYWLNKAGRPQPQLYKKKAIVSPFNAIMMGLHADSTESKTAQYVLFSEARKEGYPVKNKQTGLPFSWARFDSYIHRYKPEQVITRDEFMKLDDKDKALYKAHPTKEMRVVFNLSQTTLPSTNKEEYDKQVKEQGGRADRQQQNSSDMKLRMTVNDYILKLRENLCDIKKGTSDITFYDPRKDTVTFADKNIYPTYEDYIQDIMRSTISATGHPQRLGREAMIVGADTVINPDAEKMEMLIEEIGSAIKMQELGLPAKLSKESMGLIDFWTRELRENPAILNAVEADVNSAVAMINKAARGEKVLMGADRLKKEAEQQGKPLHYLIADQLRTMPSKEDKIMVIVLNEGKKSADVILPAGASKGEANEIPGMSKSRIEKALNKQGIATVNFYNVDGSLGYRHDDSFYRDKTISTHRLNNWDLEKLSTLDISKAVENADKVQIENIQVAKEKDGKWVMYIKPENQEGYGVYADTKDLNLFFAAVKQGDKSMIANIKHSIAGKYHELAEAHPDIKLSLAGKVPDDVDVSKVQKARLYKDKDGNFKCYVDLEGMEDKKFLPRPITQQQWQRLFIAEDKIAFKKNLAAVLFPDLLRGENIEASLDKRESKSKTISAQAPIHVTPKMVENWLKNAPSEEDVPKEFSNIMMMKDDEGKWATLVKAEGEDARGVHMDKTDLAIFFDAMKNGGDNIEDIRQAVARKAYAMYDSKPQSRVDLFKSQATESQLALIERANIYRAPATEKFPESKLFCIATIDGERQKPREVSQDQWQRMWLAPNMMQFKTNLAGTLYLDVLKEKEAIKEEIESHQEDKVSSVLVDEIDRIKSQLKTESDPQKKFDLKEQLKLKETQLSQRIETLKQGETSKKKDANVFDIPEWAVDAIVDGDYTDLTLQQKKTVDKFLEEHFPDGFVPEIVKGKEKQSNPSPAFGNGKSENTVAIRFDEAAYFEPLKMDEVKAECVDIRQSYNPKDFAGDKKGTDLYEKMLELNKKCYAEIDPKLQLELLKEVKSAKEELDKHLEEQKQEEKRKNSAGALLKQFLDLKAKHPDALLLFRTGDFYETYMEDAAKASKVLGITLTKSSRVKDPDGKPLAMAGFPYHALDTYLPKLIRAGHRIAICDQIEQPRQRATRGGSNTENSEKSEEAEQKQTPKPEKKEQSHGIHR